MTTYITWYEFNEAVAIKMEESLEQAGFDYDFVLTPEWIKQKDVFVCKECISVAATKEDIQVVSHTTQTHNVILLWSPKEAA
jgi:hypothetical protein